MNQDECENKNCASIQFLLKQKNQSIDLHESLERFFIVLIVLGFNSAKYDLHLVKPFFDTRSVNERDFELAVIKKLKKFMRFNNGEVQF